MTTKVEDFTETQYKAISGQISTNESQGIVECFVAAIGNKDSVGDICLPNCFDDSLKRRKPRVVWGHNWNEPIGKVLEIYEVGPQDPRLPVKMRTNGVGGLFAKVQFNLKSERGREAFSNIQFFGEEQEWSIGYKTLDAVFDTTKQANLLKEVELYEISPVLHGANQLTGTISIKSDESIKSAKVGPCWPGYRQIGMKKGKNGNMVPNCVPADSATAKSALKDPDGGLTAAGHTRFKRTEGANLKSGVQGAANTPIKMRRKGSFLTRFFTNPSGPIKDEKGRPTRLALSAAAWGESVPQNTEDAAKLAAKGRRLLERYENSKEQSDSTQEDVSEKNIQIYSISEASQNPIIGRMGSIAKALSSHFGGEVTIREADNNNVVFDIFKDGKSETMRAAYHTPNESDFMFGAAQPVKVETIYLPIDSNGMSTAGPIPSSPNMLNATGIPKQGCACGGACGGACGDKSSPFEKWESFKDSNPGIHLFIKTQNVEMFEVANDIANYHGFDVEMLEDGFVVPNIDWYEEDVRKALISAVESVEQKAFARIARAGRGVGRTARRLSNEASFDGDGDGLRSNRRGEDVVPYKKPSVPSMMPPRTVPQEVPERHKKPLRLPIKEPIRIPERTPAPVRPPNPVPVPEREPAVPTRVPEKVPAGISGAMRGSQLLREMEDLDMAGGPSGLPPRAIQQALKIIAKRNNMTEEQVRKEIRRAAQRRRRIDASKRLMRMQKSASKIFMSIPENSDIEIKSLLTRETASVIIPIEQEFLFQVKQLIDPVAEYYSLNIHAVEEGIQIFSTDSLTQEAIDAASSALYAAFGQVPVENAEIIRALEKDRN